MIQTARYLRFLIGGNAERIFAPYIDGVAAIDNVVQDVEFVEGNHPKLANHWFCTDLHMTK